jgi:hypothetical protein
MVKSYWQTDDGKWQFVIGSWIIENGEQRVVNG